LYFFCHGNFRIWPGEKVATILVIDDDAKLRQMLLRALDGMGHETLTAADGAECMRLFERFAPSLVITDILMPGMEGDRDHPRAAPRRSERGCDGVEEVVNPDTDRRDCGNDDHGD
jgi:ActR/RegA family two-component response regulator